MRFSLQGLALWGKETLGALAQDLKPCKVCIAFRGSRPTARESCTSLSTPATLSGSRRALPKAPLQCQSRNLCCLLPRGCVVLMAAG